MPRSIRRLLAPLGTVLVMAAAPTGAAAAGSTVTGTVTVPTGANAANVHVLLLDGAGSEVAAGTVTDNNGSTTTGSYVFGNVASGGYRIYFIDPTAADDVAPAYYGATTALASAGAVTVSANTTVPPVTLDAGGEIKGTIADPNSGDSAVLLLACQVGTPDPAQVAYWSSAANGSYSGGRVCEGVVPSAGSYALGGLVPGAGYTLLYTVQNSSHGWFDRLLADGSSVTVDPASATDFAAPSGAALTASFSIPALGSITGVVTDPGGLADTALSVQLVDAAGTVLSPAVTFSGGAYTVAGLLPGSYRLEFLPQSPLIASQYYPGVATLAGATAVTVNGAAATPNVNVTLVTAAGISGTVTAAQGGAALGGLEVEVLDANGNTVASTVTAADGTYSIPGLPSGTWYLRFDGGRAYGGAYYATDYYGGAATLAGSAPLVLAGGELLVGVNQAVLAQATAAPGVPIVSGGVLSGLYRNRGTLRFRLTSGSGSAGYLKSFRIQLPKHIGWNKAKIGTYLAVSAGTTADPYTYVIAGGQLIVTLSTGAPTATVSINPRGITVSRAIEVKARARKLAPETVTLSSTDTTGLTSSLSFVVKRPH